MIVNLPCEILVLFILNLWLFVKSMYSKTCLKQPLKRRLTIGFQDRLLLNASQMYCKIFQRIILQYFRPALKYPLSLRPLFCQILSGHLRRILP